MSKFLPAKKLICCGGGKWKTFQNKIECNSQNKWPSFCLFTTFLNNNKPNLLKIIQWDQIWKYFPRPESTHVSFSPARIFACEWKGSDGVTFLVTLFTWSLHPVIDNYFIFSNHGSVTAPLSVCSPICSLDTALLLVKTEYPGLWLDRGSGIWIGIRVINLGNNAHTNNGPWPYISPRHWMVTTWLYQTQVRLIWGGTTRYSEHCHINPLTSFSFSQQQRIELFLRYGYLWSFKSEMCCRILPVFPQSAPDNLSILTNTPIVNFTPAKEKYWHQIYLRK